MNGAFQTPTSTDAQANNWNNAENDFLLNSSTLSWVENITIAPTDQFEWCGFKDIQGATNTKTYKRLDSNDFTLPNDAVAENKIIYFYNGQALFNDAFTGIPNDGFEINTNTVSLTAFAPETDDVVVLFYFSNQAYADEWEFQLVDTVDIGGSLWANNGLLNLTRPARSLSSVWLFVDGSKWIPGVDFEFSGSQATLKNISGQTVDITSEQIVVVYY